MRNRKGDIDPLPEEFESIDEAAEFWDTHDLTDYEEFLEPVDFEADIQRRHYEIEIDEESFRALRNRAKSENSSTKEIASSILKVSLGI